jgi:hypothetical protein
MSFLFRIVRSISCRCFLGGSLCFWNSEMIEIRSERCVLVWWWWRSMRKYSRVNRISLIYMYIWKRWRIACLNSVLFIHCWPRFCRLLWDFSSLIERSVCLVELAYLWDSSAKMFARWWLASGVILTLFAAIDCQCIDNPTYADICQMLFIDKTTNTTNHEACNDPKFSSIRWQCPLS